MRLFRIFVLYTTNQVIWLRNTVRSNATLNLLLFTDTMADQITLNEVATGFSFSISAVMANRLMLSVRSRYYSSLTLIDPHLFTTAYTAERLTNLTVLEEHGPSVNDVLVSDELLGVVCYLSYSSCLRLSNTSRHSILPLNLIIIMTKWVYRMS